MGYTYTDPVSKIKYNNLPSEGTTGLNYKPQYGNNEFEYADEDGVKTFINAVEIDWNDAELDETTKINTTGDLLSLIKTLRSEVTELEGKLLEQ